jgi:putative MATE family efflux protein
VVWALAWPAVALNSLQVLNSLLDVFFVSHLPKAALAAQGGSTTMIFLMFSLAMALGTASTALVSRAYGAGKVEEFRTACRKCLSLAILAGFVFMAISMALANPAARLFLPAEDAEAIRLMTLYFSAFSAGLPALYLIQTLAGALRGIGDTKSPMVISGIQILLHIGFNYLLIFPPREVPGGITIPGFGLGLLGAGIAMALSAWLSAIAYVAFSGRTPLGEAWRITVPELQWVVRILRIALPAALMAVLRVGSLAVFVLVLSRVPNGSDAIGAMRVGFAIESIMFMPAFGLSIAASALVGQSLGMGKPDRAERLGWVASHQAALVILALVVPIFIFAPMIAEGLMGADKPEMVAQAINLIRWLCVTEIGFAYAMVTIGAMQGAGDTVRPMWITIIALWGLRVPLAWLLALPLGMGATGAWISMSLTQAIQGALAVWMFKQGKWKEREV